MNERILTRSLAGSAPPGFLQEAGFSEDLNIRVFISKSPVKIGDYLESSTAKHMKAIISEGDMTFSCTMALQSHKHKNTF